MIHVTLSPYAAIMLWTPTQNQPCAIYEPVDCVLVVSAQPTAGSASNSAGGRPLSAAPALLSTTELPLSAAQQSRLLAAHFRPTSAAAGGNNSHHFNPVVSKKGAALQSPSAVRAEWLGVLNAQTLRMQRVGHCVVVVLCRCLGCTRVKAIAAADCCCTRRAHMPACGLLFGVMGQGAL